MALPDTIATSSVERGHNPPHKSSGGNYYTVHSSQPNVYKSSDPGTVSWTEQDSANAPSAAQSGGTSVVSSISDGTYIHIVTLASTTLILRYHRFNMSTDSWDQVDSTVADLTGMTTPIAQAIFASIALRAGVTGDELVIAACGIPDTDMGSAYQRVDFWHGPDSGTPSWTGPVSLDAAAANTTEIGATAIVGTNDKVHVVWERFGGSATPDEIDQYAGRSISTSNTLSTIVTYTPTAGLGFFTPLAMTNLISYDDGGTQRIQCAIYADSIGGSGSVVLISGTEDGSDNLVLAGGGTITTDDPYDNNDFFVATLIETGGDRHLLYAGGSNGPDQDLYISSSIGGAAWSTETEILDAVTLNHISGYVLDSGFLAYLYVDGSNLKYNEYSISSAYSADLTAGNFNFTAQSPAWKADYDANMSAASFGFTAQSITHAVAVSEDMTAPAFNFTANAMGWLAAYNADMSAATFSIAGQAIDYVGDYSADMSAAAFSFTTQDLTYNTSTQVNLIGDYADQVIVGYTQAETNGAAGPINVPSGTVEGDLLVLTVFGSPVTNFPSSGWSGGSGQVNLDDNVSGKIYYKLAGASETSYNFGGTGLQIATMVSIRGGDFSNVAYNWGAVDNTNTPDPTSRPVAVDGGIFLTFVASNEGNYTTTPPTNYSTLIEDISTSSTGTLSVSLAARENLAVGTEDPGVWTTSGPATADWVWLGFVSNSKLSDTALFKFSAQGLSTIADYIADVSAASFSFTANDLTYLVGSSQQDMTAASFTFSAQSLNTIADYNLDLTAASFSFTASDFQYAGDYDLGLTAATFNFTAQAMTWVGDYSIDTSSASFNLTGNAISYTAQGTMDLSAAVFNIAAQSISTVADYLADISVASFNFTGQSLNWKADYSADMSTATFTMAGQALDVEAVVATELTSVSFNFTPADINWEADFAVNLEAAAFSFTANGFDTKADYAVDLSVANFSMSAQDLVYLVGSTVSMDTAVFSFATHDLVIGSTVSGGGFYEFSKPVLNNDASGVSFFNEEDNQSGGSSGFFNGSNNSGNKTGFY